MPDVLARLLDAVDLAVIATDVEGTVTYWSRGATALYGWSAHESVGRPIVEITPALGAQDPAEAIMGGIRSGAGWRGVFPTRRKDGSVFDCRVTLSPMYDDAGEFEGIVGVSEDVSDLHRQERDLADRTERLELALESGRMGTWRWDVQSRVVSWDEIVEGIFALAPGSFDGSMDTWVAMIHPEDREHTLAAVASSLASGSDHEVEHRFFGPDGSVRWLGGTGRVVLGADGSPVGMIGVASDITARKAAEAHLAQLYVAEQRAHAAAEDSRDRLHFLTQAGEVLAETLGFDETLRRVAELVVDRMADWCVVDLVDDEVGTVRRVVVATSVEDVGALPDEVAALKPESVDSPGEVTRVIRSGQAALHPEVTDAMLQLWARDQEHLDVMRAIGIASMVIVPLEARGRTTGALSIISSQSDRQYGRDDLSLATELARRAAVAIDNARLLAESSSVAATLQRSLLPPELPGAVGLEVAARYRPGRRGLEVGGDFYDMFAVSDDRWCLVIGDVMGKGAEAASLTGAARWTVRALAARETEPHRIVRILNETLVAEKSHNRFCTIIVAMATVRGDVVSLTIANGGHPPTLLRRANGTVERGAEGGMLVGILPDIEVASEDVDLRPGDTLLLYTDGVTEARRGSQLFGETRLGAVVAGLHGLSATACAEAIESEVIGYQDTAGRDDLAILVVKAPSSDAVDAAAMQAIAVPKR